MDPITSFSIAAGVVPVVHVSCEVLSKCHELYKDGSLAEHESTSETTQMLAEYIGQLREELDRAPKPRSRDDQELFDVSGACSKTAQGLIKELEGVRLSSDAGLRQSLKKSIRAVWKKDIIKQTQKELNSYREILNTRILLRLNSRSVEQRKDFSTLNQNIRDLVLAVTQGPGAIERLLEAKDQALRDHIDRRFDLEAQNNNKTRLEKQFMESLHFPEIYARQDQISDEHQGTCQWIFRAQEDWREDQEGRNRYLPYRTQEQNSRSWSNFAEWLEHGTGIYWINGKPGAGKSTLMNYITHTSKTDEMLSLWAKGSTLLRPSLFFWNPGTAIQKSYVGLLRSLIYQIADKAPDTISTLMGAGVDGQRNHFGSSTSPQLPTWTERRLADLLLHFLEHKPPSTNICFFIDGLDEFEGDPDFLLGLIQSIGQAKQTKVCLSSRPEQIFRQEFRLAPQLRLQDLNFRDIKKTVEDRLALIGPKYSKQSADTQSLITTIVGHAQGVYLWVDLVVRDVIRGARNQDTIEELQHRINDTPDTIDGLYAHMLSKLDKLYVPDAIKYFSMLVHQAGYGHWKLTLLDFVFTEKMPCDKILEDDCQYFLSSEFDQTCHAMEVRLETRCAGLIQISPEAHEELQIYWMDGEFPHPATRNREEGNVSCHFRPVTFIHRTAKDFLQNKQNSWLDISPEDVSSCLLYGKIGSIGLMPLSISSSHETDGYFVCVFFFNDILRLMSFQEKFEESKGLDQIARRSRKTMASHAYQIVSRVDAALNGPGKEWYKHHENILFVSDAAFHDYPGFLAFLGCYELNDGRLGTADCSKEDFTYLLACTIDGMSRSFEEDIRIRFQLVETLLDRGAEPNAQLARLFRATSTTGCISKPTIWGTVFQLIMNESFKTGSRDGDHDFKKNQENCAPWINTFLSHGADVSVNIFTLLSDSDRRDYYEMEETALSWLERHVSKHTDSRDIIHTITVLLQASGATSRRVFSRVYETKQAATPPEYMCYHLSEEYSDCLMKSWQVGSEDLYTMFENIRREGCMSTRLDERAFWSVTYGKSSEGLDDFLRQVKLMALKC